MYLDKSIKNLEILHVWNNPKKIKKKKIIKKFIIIALVCKINAFESYFLQAKYHSKCVVGRHSNRSAAQCTSGTNFAGRG